ncbi:amino acid ABC transporter permease [Paenibacillus turpanensis]|uniref:amino acid ABC transporter permease n=1 Tax=Paenibacillus turpanensis TaxID=2689078 RepID=UPI00313350CB
MFDFSWFPKYYSFFIDGAKMTVIVAALSVFFGVILGLVLALMRLSNIKPLRWFAVSYIEFIRGTPILAQIFLFYYGLPQLGINFPEISFIPFFPDLMAGVLALSFNSAAYVAETFRAGIQAIDKGQMEAARSLGMNQRTAMQHIILPQAIRNILPALGNEFIVVIKETSIVSIIGIHELMYNAETVRGNTFQGFTPILVAAVFYFLITFPLSKLLGIAERRMTASDRGK